MTFSTDYPLITIGITCYNAADTIGRAIESALSQTWPNTEIIIVDDRSSDDSVLVINLYTEDYAGKLRFFSNKHNLGVAGSRNKILAEARGQYIAFFDDDDISLPERLDIQYQTIKAHAAKTGATLISCHASICKKYPNGYETHLPAIGSRDKVPDGNDMIAYQLFLDRNPAVFFGAGTPSCSLMVETSALKQVGGYDIAMKRNEDSEISIRLGQAGAHFVGCPRELVIQYASGGKDKRPEVGYQSEMAIVEKYRPTLEEKGKYSFARGWVKLRYYHYSNQKFMAVWELVKLILRHPVSTLGRFFRTAPHRLLHELKMAGRLT